MEELAERNTRETTIRQFSCIQCVSSYVYFIIMYFMEVLYEGNVFEAWLQHVSKRLTHKGKHSVGNFQSWKKLFSALQYRWAPVTTDYISVGLIIHGLGGTAYPSFMLTLAHEKTLPAAGENTILSICSLLATVSYIHWGGGRERNLSPHGYQGMPVLLEMN